MQSRFVSFQAALIVFACVVASVGCGSSSQGRIKGGASPRPQPQPGAERLTGGGDRDAPANATRSPNAGVAGIDTLMFDAGVFRTSAVLDDAATARKQRYERGMTTISQDSLERIGEQRAELRASLPLQSDEVTLINLRGYDSPVKDQGEDGKCTAFATVAAIENVLNLDGRTVLDLSEEHQWDLQGESQTYWHALAATLDSPGIVPESAWPYGRRPAVSEADGIARVTRYDLITSSQMRSGLIFSRWYEADFGALARYMHDTQQPVFGGFRTNDSWFSQDGYIRDDLPLTPGIGHAVLVVGIVFDPDLPGGGALYIKNSWGPGWGAGGYGLIPFSYCNSAYSDDPGMYCLFYSVNAERL